MANEDKKDFNAMLLDSKDMPKVQIIMKEKMNIANAVTDMIDGTIARKLNLKSAFGSKLDSVADFLFVAAVFVKISYALYIPGWIWIAIITFIKIINLISSLFCFTD